MRSAQGRFRDGADLTGILQSLSEARRLLSPAGDTATPLDPAAAALSADLLAVCADQWPAAVPDSALRAPIWVLRSASDLLRAPHLASALQPGDVQMAVNRALQGVVDVLEASQHRPAARPGAFDEATADRQPAGARADSSAAPFSVSPPDRSIAALFPLYRTLRHLAGADRVHPADLWPCAHPWPALPADACVAPRGHDPAVLGDLEAALLHSLRQPSSLAFGALSDLCAALGEGERGELAVVWKMAAAVFEAQREGLLEADVYLKRLGAPLLSLARDRLEPKRKGPSADGGLAREALAHQLLYFAVHAAPPPNEHLAPRLSALQTSVSRPMSQPGERPTPRTLLEAVPGLPTGADLDLTGLTEAVESELPDDAVRQIGPLRIEVDRFNRFLVEADELARRLGALLGEWNVAADAAVSADAVAMAQALAVETAAIGHGDLSALCAAWARALAASAESGRFDGPLSELFLGVHGEVTRLLHQFAAGFMKPAEERWTKALQGVLNDPPLASTVPEAFAPLARQAQSARDRAAQALIQLRQRSGPAPPEADLAALDSLEREVQTLAALVVDLCQHAGTGMASSAKAGPPTEGVRSAVGG